ncbi:MAG TPA: hypothetical protein ENK32_12300 [Anaerolineae bacterium]|nr:hypothetical protein [Anaerolineae bacterium]
MRDFTKIDGHRVAKIIYGTIMVLVVILAMEEHPPSAAGSLALILMTGLGVALAESYSDYIGISIKEKRSLSLGGQRQIVHNVSGVLIGALLPAPFFILAWVGIMELEAAFRWARWALLGVLLFYGYVAARLSGRSHAFSIFFAVVASSIGVIVVLFKDTFGH